MFNKDMRNYDYFIFGVLDEYGQPQLSADVAGTCRMAIYTTSQSVQDNINYKQAAYIGLTHSLLDDTCVIAYGDKKLKVLYIQPKGRYKQVFMAEI